MSGKTLEHVDSLWRGKYYDKVTELNTAEAEVETLRAENAQLQAEVDKLKAELADWKDDCESNQ